MAQIKDKNLHEVPFMSRTEVGTAFSIASGLSFLLTAMLLPLVGKAAVKVPYYGTNFAAFLSVLLVTIVLAGLAIHSKMERRKIDSSPLPKLSMAILCASLVLLLSLLTGLLKI